MLKRKIKNINLREIEKKLSATGVQKIEEKTKIVEEFDLKKGCEFIVPVYRSRKFRKLFDKLAGLTFAGKGLRQQNYRLVVITEDKSDVILISSKEKTKFSMSKILSQIFIKVITNCGMEKISSQKTEIITYIYLPLKVVCKFYIQEKDLLLEIQTSTKKKMEAFLDLIDIKT